MNASSSLTNSHGSISSNCTDQSNKKNKNKKQTNQPSSTSIRSTNINTTTNNNNNNNNNTAQKQQNQPMMTNSASKQHLNNITNQNFNSITELANLKTQKTKYSNDNKFSSLHYVPPPPSKSDKNKTNKDLKSGFDPDLNLQRKNSSTNKPNETNKKQDTNKKTKQFAKKSQENFLNKNSREKKTPDIRARYWAYLFDNLKRAVDEIYQTCEHDNSISECKEVVLILENCTNDFRSLINRIILMKDFDKANLSNTKVNSLAWEVRKSSPRKTNQSNQQPDKLVSKSSFVMPHQLLKKNQKDSYAAEIQQILPIYSTYDDDEDDEDGIDSQEDDEDDEDDYDELSYKYKQEIDVNPMDIFNHETFSDMQSINTDDISLNTLSITPPPSTSAAPTSGAIQQTVFQPQVIPFSSSKNQISHSAASLPVVSGHEADPVSELFSIQSQKYSNDFQQPLFSISQFNQQKNRFSNFDIDTFLTPTFHTPFYLMPNSINNNNYQQSFDLNLLNSNNNNLISSLVDISNSFNTHSNYHNNSSSINATSHQNNQNFLLNESFENGSVMEDYSYRLSRVDDNLNSKKINYNLKVDSSFKVDLALEEDEAEAEDDDLDDYFENENFPDYDEFNYDEFTFKKLRNKKHQQKQPMQTASDQIEVKDEFDENFDPIDQVMLKAYEEEENLVLEIEKVQNKELLSVIAQEVKLTKQLSAEKLMHFNHQKYQKLKHKETDISTDFETYEINEKKRQRKLKNVLWENYKTDDELNYKLNDLNSEDFESVMETIRTPGRALQMHEKLLSMSRKASPNERRRKHEEKQARAQEKREQFYQDRSRKLRELTKKIEEVRELKKKLLKVKKATMKAKLQRAEEKRQYLLRLKAKKAAVEEQKAHEIAFINNLVAQNRKHDILERYEKRHEAIKHNLEEERLRKQEEQKAKEQAAELRRKELETQRMTKLKEMLEKRRIKQSKIEQTQLEKEKERIETAKAKERTREMRLAIIEAQFQANKQEVKKRIIQKQEEWSKRHESNLEEIRKKAFEMSILHFSTEDNQGGDAPTPVPYEKSKYCNACHVIISTEVQLKSHLRGSKHQQTMNEKSQGRHLTRSEIEEFNLNCIIDSPKETNEKELFINEERKKAMKKRTKKLKNKIFNKGIEYETNKKKHFSNVESTNNNNNSTNKSKISKLVKDLEKNLNSSENKQINIDKICGELNRIIARNIADQELFKNSDGLNVCVKLLEQICQSANECHNNSSKTIINIVNLLTNSCKNNFEVCCDIIMSNKLFSLLDLLNIHSNVMLNEIITNTNEYLTSSLSSSKNTNQKYLGDWMICSSLFQLVSCVFTVLNNEIQQFDKSSDSNNKTEQNNLTCRATDLLSLITSFGFIDLFSVFFSNIRGPLDDEQQTAEILKNCLNFLISLTRFLVLKNSTNVFSNRKPEDATQLINTFKATNLVNIISMLYGMLHKNASTPVKYDPATSFAENIKKKQPSSTLELATLSLKLLNQMAVLDLNMVQSSLGEDSLSLQLRHIASYLIWYLTSNKYDDLLHEIILLIGYFTVLNNDNQIKMELGTPPTILQQLCNLSFNYFSDSKLISILYPTLICCCYGNEKNKCVLTTELSSDMLANFIQEKISEDQNNKTVCNGDKYDFRRRFPITQWNQAFDYFSSKP